MAAFAPTADMGSKLSMRNNSSSLKPNISNNENCLICFVTICNYLLKYLLLLDIFQFLGSGHFGYLSTGTNLILKPKHVANTSRRISDLWNECKCYLASLKWKRMIIFILDKFEYCAILRRSWLLWDSGQAILCPWKSCSIIDAKMHLISTKIRLIGMFQK